MTTARERYEAKTSVVTFRVPKELYDELEKVKKETGLSFTDLIKLGAGIADNEVKKKLEEVADIEKKLANLKTDFQTEKQRTSDIILKERSERRVQIDLEFKAYKLFDSGWKLETVRYKLGLKSAEAARYFKQWAEMRKQKQALQEEMLRKCLELHLQILEEQYWRLVHVRWNPSKDEVDSLVNQINYCRSMRSDPTKLQKTSQDFLLAEYGSRISR